MKAATASKIRQRKSLEGTDPNTSTENFRLQLTLCEVPKAAHSLAVL